MEANNDLGFGEFQLEIGSSLFNDSEETIENKEEESTATEEIKEETEEVVENSEEQESEVEETKETEEPEENNEEPEESEESDATEYGVFMQSLIDGNVLSYDEEKEYEDSEEGVRELLNDNIEKRSQEKLEEYKKSIGEEGEDLMNFLLDGGTVDKYLEFKNGVDYSLYPLENEDGEDLVNNQKEFVYASLKNKGMDREEIVDFIESIESKGQLKSRAEKAKNELVKYQEDTKKKYLDDIKAKKEEDERIAQQEAEEFKEDVLKTREIQGFKISKSEAEQLHDFITKPVDKEGNTAFALKDNQETRMLYAWLTMKGFDRSALAKEERKKATLQLKKKLTQTQDPRANLKNKPIESNPEEENSLKDLLGSGNMFKGIL